MFRFVLCFLLVLCCVSGFAAAPVISDYNTPDDPLVAYPMGGPPTCYGDNVWEVFGVSTNWTVEVVSQPTGGLATFYQHGWTFQITTANGGDVCEVIVRVRNGDVTSNAASIFVAIACE